MIAYERGVISCISSLQERAPNDNACPRVPVWLPDNGDAAQQEFKARNRTLSRQHPASSKQIEANTNRPSAD
jgi:hypothetical protein